MDYNKLILDAESNLKEIFAEIDKTVFNNSKKVLDAFHNANVSETHFNTTTGYGYGDSGRDVIERVYADIFKTEGALVRNQFISGSHALTVALFAILRPGDVMLAISGEPYDTLKEVIGIVPNASSLKSFGVEYEQVDLVNNDFDDERIVKLIKSKKYKLIHIQRSRGYSLRESLSIEKLERIISKIKKIDDDVLIMIDNCYCELVGNVEPTEVGADLVVGSLIKNLGGGIASNGGYIVGKEKFVSLAGERLTLPGEGKEVGPSLGANKDFLKGLYMAPSVVGSSLKLSVLASFVLENMGYKTFPKWNEKHSDIVLMIEFNNSNKLIKFVQGIQRGSAVDANATAMPTDMPGYEDQIIMASGSFTQGSSIEISCDGPLRPPYVAYLQGGLTYEYAKLALIEALKSLEELWL